MSDESTLTQKSFISFRSIVIGTSILDFLIPWREPACSTLFLTFRVDPFISEFTVHFALENVKSLFF